MTLQKPMMENSASTGCGALAFGAASINMVNLGKCGKLMQSL